MNTKTLMEHSMEENGEHKKFSYLPDMHRNYPYSFGALALESFSDWMISASNLLVYAHRTRLDHGGIDKMVVLWMSKMLMERVRREEAFTTIAFQDTLSVNEHFIPNEEYKY